VAVKHNNFKERDITTLVIDRQTLPEAILPFIGSPRVAVAAERDRVVLSPAEDEYEDDDYDTVEPEGYEYDIDPADYPDTTAYLNAIPGMAESLIAMMNAPDSEFKDWNWKEELGWDEEKGIFTKVPDPNTPNNEFEA
jgi:hypothetical protein